MDPVTLGLVGSAAIGAVSSLGNSFVSNAQSKKLMAKQFHYQKKMWQMENEYNKPLNQMARLQEAGLNPNLVYGNGATALGGSMGSVSQPSAAGLDINPINDMSNYQSIVNMMKQEDQIGATTTQIKDNTKNQNDLTKADLEIKEQQAINLKAQEQQYRLGSLYSREQVYAQKIANLGAMMDLYQDAQLGGPRISKAILQNLARQYEYDNMPLNRTFSANANASLTGISGGFTIGGQVRQ